MPPSQGSNTSPLLDIEILAELSNLSKDTGFLRQIATGYLEDNHKLVMKVEIAANDRQLKELHDLLHTMKGSAQHIGASVLAEKVANLRNNLMDLSQEQILSEIEVVKRLFNESKAALLDHISQ